MCKVELRETALGKNILRLDIYIWSLVCKEQYSIGKWLIRSPFSLADERGG